MKRRLPVKICILLNLATDILLRNEASSLKKNNGGQWHPIPALQPPRLHLPSALVPPDLLFVYLLHASTGEAATMLTDESDDLGRPLRSPAAVCRRAPFLSPLSLGGRAVMSLGWIKLQRSPKEQFSGSLLLTIESKKDRKKRMLDIGLL